VAARLNTSEGIAAFPDFLYYFLGWFWVETHIFTMGRQVSHLLGTIGTPLVMLIWLSLLNPAKARARVH
jgi:hypothetical protein